MEGSLSKWTNLMKGWQYRWFVLDDCAGVLSYYLSRDQMIRGQRRGCISLKKAVIGIENEDDTTFTVTSRMKVYHFQAHDSLERDVWVRSLEDTILRHAYGSRRRKTIDFENIMKPRPTIEEFNKKLAEADAYLQVVIDQTQRVSNKMDYLQKFDDQARCSMITTYANNMLDDAKHTIVLLQIAKHTMSPENIRPPKLDTALIHPMQQKEPTVPPRMPPSEVTPPELFPSFKAVHSTSDEDFFDAIDVQTLSTISDTNNTCSSAEDDKSSPKLFSTTNENVCIRGEKVIGVLTDRYSHANDILLESSDLSETMSPSDNETCEVDVPEENDHEPYVLEHSIVSTPEIHSTTDENALNTIGILTKGKALPLVSSDQQNENESESDDETYDVEEKDTDACTHQDSFRLGQTIKCNEETTMVSTSESTQAFQREDGTLNYDYFYECREESDVEIEFSVVSHLLSQVKIGMDLSKVVLPIFILEKRSLLEMYADFFAHPDLFLGITDQPDARRRMVQVVKWYVTAFHAGRKTSIPKKPYNPILGEIFRCFWDIPGETSEGELFEGGPVPWCTGNRLAFAAEQVSHHPPVSAFYAECPYKRISCTASVWTKSKFLGLSIGVANEGKALVNLLDHDEQYSLTFPSAYGRSIFTKPWFELGGTINIICEKTGYSAKIDFLTKPFYGTKKHKIAGEIFERDSKKPFLTIEGEWCGTIKARTSEGEEDVLADVQNMMVSKKTVRPVSEQECYESRQVWKEVTAGLWLNDISRASNAKIEVESRQRKEEQTRKENGIEWKTRLFETEATGNWIYKTPLENRIAAIKKISPALQ